MFGALSGHFSATQIPATFRPLSINYKMGRIDIVQISTIIKTWQTLSNGEHPIVTKVYINKRKKLFATGLSSSLGKWKKTVVIIPTLLNLSTLIKAEFMAM